MYSRGAKNDPYGCLNRPEGQPQNFTRSVAQNKKRRSTPCWHGRSEAAPYAVSVYNWLWWLHQKRQVAGDGGLHCPCPIPFRWL